MITKIITHPLWGNYGGMLQAYALQMTVQTIYATKAEVVQHIPNQLNTVSYFKYILRKLQLYIGITSQETPVHQHLFYDNGMSFANKHAFTTLNEQADRYIVGSDQVWRKSAADFIGGISQFFLNFASKEQRHCSIAYAASFGTDSWEGTPEETETCRKLLKEFKAVSVREQSGIKICKEVFGVDAVQMPDPTLLLQTEDYDQIISSEKTWIPNEKFVAAYVLDETGEKSDFLQQTAIEMNTPIQHLMPHANAKKRRDRFPISVPQWLRLIRDCEYFVTDSFHGCVFAIIFNKPFVCLGNAGRGSARFDTLLGTFGLENRLITDATREEFLRVLKTPINWERINDIRDAERERGIHFLKENLN